MDLRTCDDLFAACPTCDKPADASPQRLDFLRCNRCPLVPEREWTPIALSDLRSHDLTADIDCCPGAWARSPAAVEATRARRWWEKNPASLAVLYPDGIPAVVIQAVEAAEGARLAWEADHAAVLREDAAQRDRTR